MNRRRAMIGACLVLPALGYAAQYVEEVPGRAEDRVGREYWVRPGLNDTSVDFYVERELRTRVPVRDKRRTRVVDIESVSAARGSQIVYRVRFDDGSEAYIALTDFDRRLYRDLAPNQVMTAPPDSPVGAAPHLWIFQRSSVFTTDPDIIWDRIKNEGARTFVPAKKRPHGRSDRDLNDPSLPKR